MTVWAEEFVRRFLFHVLPKGFVRIRQFGFMSNSQRAASLELCRQLLDMAPIVRSTETSNTSLKWLRRGFPINANDFWEVISGTRFRVKSIPAAWDG